MKRILILALLCLFAFSIALAQTGTVDPNRTNSWKNYTAATTGDTVTSRDAKGNTPYLVSLVFNTNVGSDTVIIKDATRTVLTLIHPSTAPAAFTLPVNALLDTSLILVKKKTSNVTLIYRTRR